MILAFDVWATHGTWGTVSLTASNAGVRDTQLHPGKAPILGILGAALGTPRDRLPELASQVRVACRTDAMPRLQSSADYESTRRSLSTQAAGGLDRRSENALRKAGVNPAARAMTRFEEMRAFEMLVGKSGSIVSRREFWTGGGWTVFVAGAEALLARMADALRTPAYGIHAGRRSCPLAFPPAPELLEADGLKQAAVARPALQRRIAEPDILAQLASTPGPATWRTRASGPLHWEEGFPDAPMPTARQPVRQAPIAGGADPGTPRHRLRLFVEYYECSCPGGVIPS